MAVIQHKSSKKNSMLRPRHLVGRSRLAHLKIDDPSVSGEHAVIVWTGSAWELRDMGSRNGTFVNDKRLESGERHRITKGCILRFGSEASDWQLVDARQPVPMIIENGKLDARPIEGGLVALPDEENPEVTVFKNARDEWMCESYGETEPISSVQQVKVKGKIFEVVLPETWASTTSGVSPRFSIENIILRFYVSSDEEYVRLQVSQDDREIDLGARAHHYILLTLARARKEDIDHGFSKDSQGWTYFDELAKGLDMDETHINVGIYRCRQQLNGAEVSGAADIIERRRMTRQIRLGVERFEIIQL